MSRNRMMMLAAGALICAWSVAAQDNPAPPAPGQPKTLTSTSPDAMFARDAAAGGMAEVEIGRLALQQASNARVKQFAQRMIDDHSKANDELKSVAVEQGIDLPADIDAKHAAVRDRLSGLSGAAFDKAYMDAMVEDHQHVASMFETEANGGSDAAVKAFAAKTLPTIREHLTMARDTQRELSGSTTGMGMTTGTRGETTTTAGTPTASPEVPSAASSYPLAALVGLVLVGAGALLARKR